MVLSIEDEKTCHLAQDIARRTGESTTEAVYRAVQERLERICRAERTLQIGKECAAHIEEPFTSIDLGEMLYDEKGLPK